MSACSHDSEGKIAPLAIGIADIENELNWIYFLRFLAKCIPELKTSGMVIMCKGNDYVGYLYFNNFC